MHEDFVASADDAPTVTAVTVEIYTHTATQAELDAIVGSVFERMMADGWRRTRTQNGDMPTERAWLMAFQRYFACMPAFGAASKKDEGDDGDMKLAFPAIEYTGNHIRRVQNYNDEWFYEYIFTESGTLTVPNAIQADLMLVGSGGLGAAAPYNTQVTKPSPGGGSGFPEYAQGVSIAPDEYEIIVGTPDNDGASEITINSLTLTAARGGDASADSYTASVGDGFEGTYYLYGDENLPAGEGGGATGGVPPPNQMEPGHGGGGCQLLPFVSPEWGTSRKFTSMNFYWWPVKPGYSGFGAGGMGYSPRYILGASGYIFEKWNPKPAQGVVALRVRV